METVIVQDMQPLVVDELLAAARRGDRASFDQVFDLWFDALYAKTSVDRKRVLAQPLIWRLLVGCVRNALVASEGGQPGESRSDPRRRVSIR